MTCRPFDVVVVPFPFTDISASKRRPALVLSDEQGFNTPVGHSVMAMITTASQSSWTLGTAIIDLPAAGLTTPSIVRMKLFTLDHVLISKQIGRLGSDYQDRVKASLRVLLPL